MATLRCAPCGPRTDRRWPIAGCLLLALAPLPALAGRPVFAEVSLPQLVALSDAIVVARTPAAFRPTTITLANGCRSPAWLLSIEAVLHRSTPASPAASLLRPGRSAEILIAPTSLKACANFRVDSRPVSFPASLYRSSLGPLSRPPEQLVLFLRHDRGHWQLAAEGSYESVGRLGAIRQAIPRPPSAATPSR